eukprot:1456042-Pleurochrysis_carterae.AAC.1
MASTRACRRRSGQWSCPEYSSWRAHWRSSTRRARALGTGRCGRVRSRGSPTRSPRIGFARCSGRTGGHNVLCGGTPAVAHA